MQKRSPTSPGRPASFDEQAVVANAINVFWSCGYAGATLDMLESATGVDRSTIYNSFGGKAGLYERAATEYLGQGDRQLFSPLSDGIAGLDDIVEFLNRVEAIQRDDSTPPGCLIINDLASPASNVLTDQYLARIRGGLAEAIERSNTIDGTDPGHNTTRQDVLVAAIIGANLSHRRNPSQAAATKMIDGLRGLVRSWVGN